MRFQIEPDSDSLVAPLPLSRQGYCRPSTRKKILPSSDSSVDRSIDLNSSDGLSATMTAGSNLSGPTCQSSTATALPRPMRRSAAAVSNLRLGHDRAKVPWPLPPSWSVSSCRLPLSPWRAASAAGLLPPCFCLDTAIYCRRCKPSLLNRLGPPPLSASSGAPHWRASTALSRPASIRPADSFQFLRSLVIQMLYQPPVDLP